MHKKAFIYGFITCFIVCNNVNAKRPLDCEIRYSRACFNHWIDADNDCLTTRNEILQMQSAITVKIQNCKVTEGQWFDVYSNKIYSNAGILDIDHIVPLQEAWFSGANKWDEKKSENFANDYENLIVTSSSLNRSKGTKDLTQWLPPAKEYVCEYVQRWVYIKTKYNLAIDVPEQITIDKILKDC